MEQLTSAQLVEWQAYDELEPIGEKRADYRTALLCMVIKNLAISAWASKGTKPATINEFLDLMDWDSEPEEMEVQPVKSKEPMTQDVLNKAILDWAKMSGAIDKRKKK